MNKRDALPGTTTWILSLAAGPLDRAEAFEDLDTIRGYIREVREWLVRLDKLAQEASAELAEEEGQ